MASYKKPYQKKTNAPAPGSLYKPVSVPSEEQEKIFDAVLNSDENLMIEAFAGCGKTTTCVEAMYRSLARNPKLSPSYIIYAKRNQEEAIAKCPPTVVCKTAHAFGLNAIAKTYGKVFVDKYKNDKIASALVGDKDEDTELRYMLGKAMDLGKDYLATTSEEIDFIIDKHGLERGEMDPAQFANKVLEGMELSAQQTNSVSFSDMVWLPLKLNLRVPTFPVVYADEWQDLNRARFELVFRSLGDKGRLIAVGDGFQSIFGFSGADRHALSKAVERSNAKKLPLHKTFRCAKAIVRLAQSYVPDYQAADTNPEGLVDTVSEQTMINTNGYGVGAGDFILSRTNAPLMKYAMRFLKEGRRCNIQGKDLGGNLLSMIRRSRAKDVVSFQHWLEDWAKAEIERLEAKKRGYEHVVDKKECFDALCEGRQSLDEVKQHIQQLFDDKDDDESLIMLSTIHKAKGLERKRVWLLEKSFVMRPKTDEEKEQERNVRYVAITRAKDSLFLVG